MNIRLVTCSSFKYVMRNSLLMYQNLAELYCQTAGKFILFSLRIGIYKQEQNTSSAQGLHCLPFLQNFLHLKVYLLSGAMMLIFLCKIWEN